MEMCGICSRRQAELRQELHEAPHAKVFANELKRTMGDREGRE